MLPLVVFALVATGTPGGATTLATVSGAHFGFRRSIPLMAGIALGLGAMAGAAAAGLAGFLLAAPALQFSMKAAGSLYLTWLAWKIARSGRPRLDQDIAGPSSFVAGVILPWYNPKAWAMTLGAAASFGALADGPYALAGLVGVTFGGAAALSLALWCLTGLMLARVLRTDGQWRMVNIALGAALVLTLVPMWL